MNASPAELGGLLLVLEPRPQVQSAPAQEPELRPEVQEPNGPDSATVRASIIQAVNAVSAAESRAFYWLDPTILESVFQGEYLRIERIALDGAKRNKQFRNCRREGIEFHNIDVDERARRATADVTAHWNCAYYSVESGNCDAQYESINVVRQTLYMEQETLGWMVSNIDFDENNAKSNIVACTGDWPANVQR